MNTKLFICFLSLIVIAGGGCANKKALVRDNATVQYAKGNQENMLEGTESISKIPLKSMRVLVIDDTDTQMEYPFQEPLRIYSDDSVSIDSLIESRHYNYLLLSAFKKSSPRKANMRVLTKKLSRETLDSLIRADKFDLVITARHIRFNYQYRYAGMKYINEFYKSSKPQGVKSGSTTLILHTGVTGQHTTRHAGNSNALTMGEAFDFSSNRGLPSILTRTVIYQTRWDFQWTDPTIRKKDTTPQQLDLEGFRTDGVNDNAVAVELLFSDTCQQAGKNLAQLFSW